MKLLRPRSLRIALYGCLIIFVFITSMSMAADQELILGLWHTPDKDSKIEIFICGDYYCGRIAWLQEPDYPPDDKGGMAGKPQIDRNNPDPHLRTRPLINLNILEGFIYMGDNLWAKGNIYNPEDGQFYKGKMKLATPSRLEVRGFIGISLFGGTSVWTRESIKDKN
ncbi:MAG: DUF2147 domain-containing protein [Candidatus Tectomicrobia bacterium]|uniref:DUF2147 domain-containing protein n=1 Tax=Tectimicrobiota bacterium TaxID=2528274 RepID=A0A933GJ37_UNCTE|nr:DUF2147 domain-containing protein [Candidatus Tectomicrobia bacterium]